MGKHYFYLIFIFILFCKHHAKYCVFFIPPTNDRISVSLFYFIIVPPFHLLTAHQLRGQLFFVVRWEKLTFMLLHFWPMAAIDVAISLPKPWLVWSNIVQY